MLDGQSPLAISVGAESRPRRLVLSVSGEMDMLTSAQLTAALHAIEAGRCREVAVDLGDVSYIDSSGLRVLLEARRVLADQDIDLRVIRPQPHACRLFEITGTADLLCGGSDLARLSAQDGDAATQSGSMR